MDAVLARLSSTDTRASATCRMGGDTSVLLEYGPVAFDLGLNVYAHAIAEALTSARVPGVTEVAPGIRSLLVHFDPHTITPQRLAQHLMDLHSDDVPARTVATGRTFTLPLAFDDSTTRQAVARHRTVYGSERTDASDIATIVASSGLSDGSELLSSITSKRWCVAFIGYYPGLPFLLSMSDDRPLRAPKLVQQRAWTADGAVTLGGACVAIFPVSAPGSYRVFGRTVPIYSQTLDNEAFADDEMLLRPGDIVEFEPVSEDDLADARRAAYENRYTYQVSQGSVPSGDGDA